MSYRKVCISENKAWTYKQRPGQVPKALCHVALATALIPLHAPPALLSTPSAGLSAQGTWP